jgi:hypothetical protein
MESGTERTWVYFTQAGNPILTAFELSPTCSLLHQAQKTRF